MNGSGSVNGSETLTDPTHPALQMLEAGRLHDPWSILGPRTLADGRQLIVVYRPGARSVRLASTRDAFRRIGDGDAFEWVGDANTAAVPYRLLVEYRNHIEIDEWDAYAFPADLDPDALDAFGRGDNIHSQSLLGAHELRVQGVDGVRFATWAPDAARVSVVGDFNAWDGRRHPMCAHGGTGVWALFVPGLAPGELYKFELRNRDTGTLHVKADPYARLAELRPATASVVAPRPRHAWGDARWLQRRASRDWLHAPMSIYEVHAGAWRRGADGRTRSYRELAHELVPYVRRLGFTHIELMPLTEYPLDESWGYQPTGYFAPTCRYGEPDDLRYFVDFCHRHDVGVLLDWVPGHFPRDAHGLARFDGTALYEYPDPLKADHPDWGTLVFNYDRNEVRSFLLSSALYWLEAFHFDGLRVDAVASMLYLDYSRVAGQWRPNAHGGNENLEAITFLRHLNEITHAQVPGSVTIAEESTAWPGVSRPGWAGGLGFSMKWNLGWMHDTLAYLAKDPIHRNHHHALINFAALYAFSENFVLPLSHDEVVHGKRSLLGRMPGDDWQRFANLRLLYALQWTFPGKKLLFMGGELAQPWEWDASVELGWHLLDSPDHKGVQRLIGDLNRLYTSQSALHRFDFEPEGFQWLEWNDHERSTLAYLRTSGQGDDCVVLLNFTPVVRYGYAVGVPHGGIYRHCLNTDARCYGGSGVGNPAVSETVAGRRGDHPNVLTVTLPPLAATVLQRTPE